jgi:hypothetical protein
MAGMVLFLESWARLVAFGGDRSWIAAGTCYAVGYIVQVLSRSSGMIVMTGMMSASPRQTCLLGRLVGNG